MAAQIIDGKSVAEAIKGELKGRVQGLKEKGIIPGLAAVLIGENLASQTYVASKAKACEKVGIYSEVIRRPAEVSHDEVLGIVRDLNRRSEIDGILVQSPLPKHIDEFAITLAIDPAKDVDGFHPHNVGMMLIGRPGFLSCTPYGIMELLKRYGINPAGKEVVIMGRSNIVGKPMAALLVQKQKGADATVTVCHSRTPDMPRITRRADILIAAMGQPEFVRGDMIKEGAVVIDVGVNRVEDAASTKGYRLVGDVAFEEAAARASYITPVPGGVGPMTIAMLLTNTVQAAENRRGK